MFKVHFIPSNIDDPDNYIPCRISDDNDNLYWQYNDGNVMMAELDKNNEEFNFTLIPAYHPCVIFTC